MIEGDYAGFIFRANNDYNQYYLFIVGKSKEFALYFYDDNADDKSIIIERSNSDLLKGGTDQENIVGVIARGNTFKLYFNNQYAKTLTDQKNRLTGAGHLGFIALDNGSETEVAYTQAQVWQL